MSGPGWLQFLLRHPGRFPPKFVDTLLTQLMLVGIEDWEVARPCIDGLSRGRWRVDDRAILNLFRSVPASLQIDILDSIPISRARVSTFTELFMTCYRTRPAAPYWHPRLARSLWFFIERHPKESTRFEREMRRLITFRDQEVASLSVRLVPFLPAVSLADLKLIVQYCGHHYGNLRMNAFNALQELVQRPRRLEPNAREFLTDMALVARIRKFDARNDRDKNLRTSVAQLAARLRVAAGK